MVFDSYLDDLLLLVVGLDPLDCPRDRLGARDIAPPQLALVSARGVDRRVIRGHSGNCFSRPLFISDRFGARVVGASVCAISI